jgi:hypothetical protein
MVDQLPSTSKQANAERVFFDSYQLLTTKIPPPQDKTVVSVAALEAPRNIDQDIRRKKRTASEIDDVMQKRHCPTGKATNNSISFRFSLPK